MEPKKPQPDTADLSENRIVVSKNITKDGMFVECIFFIRNQDFGFSPVLS